MPYTIRNKRCQQEHRGCRAHCRATIEPADVDLQGGAQRRRAARVRPREPPDHPIDLVERQRRRGQHGRPVGDSDGVAQLRGHRGPGRVAVAAMQIGAAQAAGHARHHHRADQTGAVADPHQRCAHPWLCNSRSIRGSTTRSSASTTRSASAAVTAACGRPLCPHPRTRASQRAEPPLGQRPVAVHADPRDWPALLRLPHNEIPARHQLLTSSLSCPCRASPRRPARRADRMLVRRLHGAQQRGQPAVVSPAGGRTSTARRGSQPTCTTPSGRSSTGIAGSSVYSDGVTAPSGTVPRLSANALSYPQAPVRAVVGVAASASLLEIGDRLVDPAGVAADDPVDERRPDRRDPRRRAAGRGAARPRRARPCRPPRSAAPTARRPRAACAAAVPGRPGWRRSARRARRWPAVGAASRSSAASPGMRSPSAAVTTVCTQPSIRASSVSSRSSAAVCSGCGLGLEHALTQQLLHGGRIGQRRRVEVRGPAPRCRCMSIFMPPA